MKISKKIIEYCINAQIVDDDDLEIIEYGLNNLFSSLIGFVIIIIIGVVYGCFLESIVFWILAMPLRKNAGGYHAKGRITCNIISALSIMIMFWIYFKINISWSILHIITIIFILFIFCFSPVESMSKPLEKIEYIVYIRRTRITLVCESIFYILVNYLHWKNLCKVTSMSIVVVGISLIAGHISLKKTNVQNLQSKSEGEDK